jgi:hypothetical protein
MGRPVEALLHEAMELTAEERSYLAEELLHTVLSDEEREIEREWLAVADRRSAEIAAGTAATVPLDEAIENARRALKDASSGTARRG